MGGVGSAHGKLILFGEHAAVYGHPAVGMALPETTRVTLEGAAADEWGVGGLESRDRAAVLRIIGRIEGPLGSGRPMPRCSVRIASTVPRGVGFGSSSALCGAFARAMLAHAGADPMGSGSDRAWELAHAAEKLFHGTPSGIDTGLSLLGGVRALFPQPAGLPSVRPLPGAPLWLVVAGVARDGACGALVGGLSARMRAGDGDVRESVEALGALARRALECLEAPPGSGPAADLAGRLAGLASRAMEHLRRLGLGNPAQDRLLEAGVRAGALGGKLSGAGAGGAFFLIASDRDSARAVAQRLRDEAGSAGIVLSAPARAVYAGRDAGEPES